MVNVEVHFFGGVQHFTRKIPADLPGNRMVMTLPDGATVEDLLTALGVGTKTDRPFVSINRFYERRNVPLGDGDRVELVLPVAGGAR